jgi:hypothetical protein
MKDKSKSEKDSKKENQPEEKDKKPAKKERQIKVGKRFKKRKPTRRKR